MTRAPRKRPDPSPTSPDPIEIAMEAEAKDFSPDSPARQVLLEQLLLIRTQTALGRRQIVSENLGATLKVLTGLAGLAAAIALVVMVWTASRADNLVIEAFSVPPALAARGITGEALARQLSDDLAAIAEVAQSPEQQRGLSGDWGKSLTVEIPETGISLSQLDQWLREKLGHQSHISGEVMASPDGGLTLAARSGSHGLPPLKGAEGDMASLIQQTAEAVYAREQPRSMGLYFMRTKRFEESHTWYLSRVNAPAARDRASSYLGLAWNTRGRFGDLGFAPLARKSIAADPTYSPAVANLGFSEHERGHLESAYQLMRRAGVLAARDANYVAQWRREQTMQNRSQVATFVGDWREARAWKRELLGKHLLGNGDSGSAGPSADMARVSAAMHDIRQARADLAAYDAVTSGDIENYQTATLIMRMSAEDWTGAVMAADEILAGYESLPDKGHERVGAPTLKARALAHLGRIAEAQALIGATPLDCQPCVAARGEIAALAGDARTADHWFGEAVRMAPSIPFANTDWGRVLLDRGETEKAIERLAAANRQGPHFADPISFWGEGLLKQSKAKAAVAKFREADKYAPRWGRNHLLWGQALAKLGKAEQAREQFKLAAGMDLSAADRAELVKTPR